jgi:hypothetical protein
MSSSSTADATTGKQPKVFEKVAGRISKNVKEVQGSVEKVLDETKDALEEFLGKSKFFAKRDDPRVEGSSFTDSDSF